MWKITCLYLLSSKFFRKFQINLVGFSLGNHVIKHCLKELFKIQNINCHNYIKFKNVIFIAGAIQITNKSLWKRYIENFITDRIINCYTKNDWALKYAYKFCMVNKEAIGNDELEIKNDQNINLVTNYDFTSYKWGILIMIIE